MLKLPTSLSRFFWYFIKKQSIAFLAFFFFLSPCALILEVNVIPYAFKMLIDIITGSHNKSTAIKEMLPALCLGGSAWLGVIIIARLQQWWQAYVIPHFESDIRMSTLNYMIFHSYNYFSNHQAGNIANKISNISSSIEAIRKILCRNCIPTFMVIIVTLIIMSRISSKFSWILAVWLGLHFIITTYFAKIIYKVSKKNAEDKSTLSGSIVDTISNIISVKLFARHSYELEYIGRKQVKEKISNTNLIITMNVFEIFIDIPIAIMLGTTIYFLITGWEQGTITTGDFVFIFNMVFAILYQMWSLGHVLVDLFREIGQAQEALTLIFPHQIADSNDAKQLRVTKGEIEFKNVNFHYKNKKNIFTNKNVLINPGEKVGLVGYSGSGKTTFINLILRFFDVDSGKILIDGQDITKVTQDSLHYNIAMVPQDIYLFHRTLMENIRYGQVNSSEDEVIKASKKAYCHNFITELPNGYNSIVGERGTKLSGGQRQRIAIARSILKDAPILILDEASSALDSVTEKYVQEALYQLMQDRTTIVIAHRLSTLSKMDRILVFDKGYIVEDGTHEELLQLNGHYANIWKMQAADGKVDI